jgi:Mg2+ and Co2+ transporter CorA
VSWYALDDPNDQQLDVLASQFQFHPFHIKDCRCNNKRIKAEGSAAQTARGRLPLEQFSSCRVVCN